MKTIVVIGASSGIGRGVARAFAREGWKVGVTARREDALRELADEFPGMVLYSAFDVAAPEAADRFNDLVDRLGGIDVLLYAAGCGWYNPGLDPADDSRTVATNVAGFTRIADAAFARFARRSADAPRGRFAAITSVAGVKGLGISAAYSASKRYQWTYIQALAQLARMRGLNVGFTDIRPGFIRTALLGRGPSHLPMTMSPDFAVAQVVKAIRRGRRVTVIDCRWRLLTMLWSALPAAIWPRLKIRFK